MDWSNWQEEERNLNNLVDSVAVKRNIYVTANKINYSDISWFYSTRLNLAFYVIHRTCSDTNPTREAQIVCSRKIFPHLFDRFESIEDAKALVASMFFEQHMPFSFDTVTGQGLHWKELIANNDASAGLEQASLQDFDDVVSKISEAAACITREASALGHKFVTMTITIDKRTVVPQQEFERVIPHYVELSEIWDHENPQLYLQIENYYTYRYISATSLMESSRWWCYLTHDDDHDSLHHDQSVSNDYHESLYDHRIELNDDEIELNDDEIELTSAIEESFSQLALDIASVPAAKSEVELLEKYRFNRSSDDEDESKLVTCMICMEEVMSGSHLTRMPCSHLYHSDCISEWLLRNHTCPICRFKLPS